MATLINLTDSDVFCAVLHVMVPANGSVEIADEDAERVQTSTGVFSVTNAATRTAAKRGSDVAEVSSAPAMETR